MKSLISLIAVAAVCALGAGTALAHPATGAASKTLTVVMHDPGCHWFSVNGKFLTKVTVNGPIKLANTDEAALKVHVVGISARGDRLDPVGHWVRLDPGHYTITMVGQAPDDNHLKLTVR